MVVSNKRIYMCFLPSHEILYLLRKLRERHFLFIKLIERRIKAVTSVSSGLVGTDTKTPLICEQRMWEFIFHHWVYSAIISMLVALQVTHTMTHSRKGNPLHSLTPNFTKLGLYYLCDSPPSGIVSHVHLTLHIHVTRFVF